MGSKGLATAFRKMMLELRILKNSDWRIRQNAANHYSAPDGFVGRNICYGIFYSKTYYGSIVAGSALMYLAGRDEFFGLNKTTKAADVQTIINNTFYHIERVNGRYPVRNFAVAVLKTFREQSTADWLAKYGDTIIGYESLIELPRTGEIYRRDGWTRVGQTIGNTCKRMAGKGTDSWSGKRVWDTTNLRPKHVFCRLPGDHIAAPLIAEQLRLITL